MTPQQTRFIQQYMIDLNATQAAIRSGYAPDSASVEGCRLLSIPKIAVEVTRRLKERAEMAEIDALWVLKRAAKLANFNIEDFIVEEDGKAYYDFRKATRDDWYCISEYTVKTIRGKGDSLIPVEEVKLKAYDKLRALELVGKHVDVAAFKERLEHSGRVELDGIERTIVDP